MFATTAIEFLGHKVSAASVKPCACSACPPRADQHQRIAGLPGHCRFLPQILPAAARILKPLTDLLIGGPKCTEPVSLGDLQRAAFVAAKDTLAAATCLVHPS